MKLTEYRYTYRGVTIKSLTKLARWQVVELVKNRLEADEADRKMKKSKS